MTISIDEASTQLNQTLSTFWQGQEYRVTKPRDIQAIYDEAFKLTGQVYNGNFTAWIKKLNDDLNGISFKCKGQADLVLDFTPFNKLSLKQNHFQTKLVQPDLDSSDKIEKIAKKISELSQRILSFSLGESIYQNLLTIKKTRCFILENDEHEIVGFFLGTIMKISRDNQKIRVLNCWSLAREANYPKAKIFQKVFEKEDELIRNDKIQLITLSVVLTNLKAFQLYLNQGFKIVEESFYNKVTKENGAFLVKQTQSTAAFIPSREEMEKAVFTYCYDKMKWKTYYYFVKFFLNSIWNDFKYK